MVFSRRPRPIDEMMRDPNFPYVVGRLMGAAEMSAHWMSAQEDPQTQEMGRKLADVVGWFFRDGPDASFPAPQVRDGGPGK